MKQLLSELNEYLNLRRGLGFKLGGHDIALRKFILFLHDHGATFITTQLALEWAQQPQQASQAHRAHRLGMARDFARYLSAKDPRVEVPPRDLLPGQAQRSQPYIYSGAQILKLVQTASTLKPCAGLRPRTQSTVFGLLAVTGMRMGEITALKDRDVDLQQGVLTVRQSKGNKTRLIPVHPSTQEQLRQYARFRDKLVPIRTTDRFFVFDRGTGITKDAVRYAFIHVSRQIGLRSPTAHRGPRLHDLRHTFAVRTLIEWHRAGIDPEQRLPMLSAYLGHAKVSDTYWYLSAVPELLSVVSKRLEHFLGDRA